MYEACYYLDIIANKSYAEWDDFVMELKAKALKLQLHMRDYEEYERANEL